MHGCAPITNLVSDPHREMSASESDVARGFGLLPTTLFLDHASHIPPTTTCTLVQHVDSWKRIGQSKQVAIYRDGGMSHKVGSRDSRLKSKGCLSCIRMKVRVRIHRIIPVPTHVEIVGVAC